MDILDRLQSWYASHCDGDWEHGFGIRISTLDNPGWRLTVNLEETSLEHATFERQEIERTDTDWFRCWVKDKHFEAAGGAFNLKEMLGVFIEWAESNPGDKRNLD